MLGSRRIAVIGTGRMGSGIASRLASQGHDVTVWNRTIEKARRLEGKGVKVASSLQLALGQAEAAILALSDDNAVISVLSTMGRSDGLIVIDTSTITPQGAVRASRIAFEYGACYISSPVIGGPGAAEAGDLLVLVSGPRRCVAAVRDILESISRRVFVLSEDVEAAPAVKLAYNSMLFSFVVSLSESLMLAEAYGVDRDTFKDILSETVFAEPGIRYIDKMGRSEPDQATFPISMTVKDLDYAVMAGSARSVPMSSARLAGGLYTSALRHGCGGFDYAGLYLWMDRGRC